MINHVTLYSHPECPNCAELKQHLDAHRITYTDRDITSAKSVREEMVETTGSMSVPTLVAKDQIVIGADWPKIRAALGTH